MCPKSKRQPHKQVWVKVNAPVDQGIADLIQALSAFPRLHTIESCQGGLDNPAWVCFYYGDYWVNPWRDLADFVLGFLGPALAREAGDDVNVSIRVTGCGLPQGELTIRPGRASAVTEALINLFRSWGCSGGRSDTSL